MWEILLEHSPDVALIAFGIVIGIAIGKYIFQIHGHEKRIAALEDNKPVLEVNENGVKTMEIDGTKISF